MKKTKKILALFLALTLLVGTIGVVGKPTTSSAGIKSSSIKLTQLIAATIKNAVKG